MKRFLRSARCALRGIAASLRGGRNARLQLAAAVLTVGGGLWLGLLPGEWLAVILCIGMVLMAETFNSALEQLADEVSLEKNPRIGLAKDMAAGAVLLAAFTALAVAAVILARHLTEAG